MLDNIILVTALNFVILATINYLGELTFPTVMVSILTCAIILIRAYERHKEDPKWLKQ